MKIYTLMHLDFHEDAILIFLTLNVCSVGSLGKDGAYENVEEVQVQNCTFIGTQNGVRIKTWKVTIQIQTLGSTSISSFSVSCDIKFLSFFILCRAGQDTLRMSLLRTSLFWMCKTLLLLTRITTTWLLMVMVKGRAWSSATLHTVMWMELVLMRMQ